jgi:hypothetical protein
MFDLSPFRPPIPLTVCIGCSLPLACQQRRVESSEEPPRQVLAHATTHVLQSRDEVRISNRFGSLENPIAMELAAQFVKNRAYEMPIVPATQTHQRLTPYLRITVCEPGAQSIPKIGRIKVCL